MCGGLDFCFSCFALGDGTDCEDDLCGIQEHEVPHSLLSQPSVSSRNNDSLTGTVNIGSWIFNQEAVDGTKHCASIKFV